jgi:hypothetical protein
MRDANVCLLRCALLAALLGAGTGSAQTATTPAAAPLILSGTVLTPDRPLEHGFVLIEDGRIRSVMRQKPKLRGATVLHTHGIIAPGFVDLHHVSYAALPRWNPSALFTNKYQWRTDPDFQREVVTPYTHALSDFCDLNAWGELRALAGGTTLDPGDRGRAVHPRPGAQPRLQQRLLRHDRARPRTRLQHAGATAGERPGGAARLRRASAAIPGQPRLRSSRCTWRRAATKSRRKSSHSCARSRCLRPRSC